MRKDINSYIQSRLSVIARLIDGISGILAIIIFVNILELNNLGRYFILVSIVQSATSPTKGITTCIKHMVSRENKKNDYTNIISSGVIMSLLLSITITTLGLGMYFLILSDFYTIYKIEIIFVTIFIISKTILFSLNDSYRGLGYPSKAMFLLAGQGIIQTILQITLLIVFDLGIIGLLGGTIISMILSSIYLITRDEIKFGYPRIDLNYFYNYAKWVSTQKTVSNLHIKIDALILGLLVSSSSVGLYRSVMKITRTTTFVGSAINQSIFVKFSKAKNGYPIDDLNINGSYVSLLSIPMFFGGIIVGEDLLKFLYGSEFTEAYYILVLSCLYVFLRSNSNVIENALNGSGHPEKATIYQMISLFIFFISSYVFINLFGFNGIVISLIISEAIRFILLIYGFKQITGSYYNPHKIKFQAISSIIMSVIVYCTSMFLTESIISLVLLLLVGFISYTVMIILLDDSARKYVSSKI